jgi:hypothetical protein
MNIIMLIYYIFTSCGKLTHVKYKAMKIIFPRHILNNITSFSMWLHKTPIIIYYMSYYNVICYIMSLV